MQKNANFNEKSLIKSQKIQNDGVLQLIFARDAKMRWISVGHNYYRKHFFGQFAKKKKKSFRNVQTKVAATTWTTARMRHLGIE